MRLGSKLRRTLRVRGLRRSGVVTLPPGIPRLGVVFRRIHFQGCALKSGPVARSEALTRDGDRKVELYQSFCNIVGGVMIPPCGVPSSVGESTWFSMNPAFSHDWRIVLSSGTCARSQS